MCIPLPQRLERKEMVKTKSPWLWNSETWAQGCSPLVWPLAGSSTSVLMYKMWMKIAPPHEVVNADDLG